MVRVASLVGFALALVVQVFANSDVVVNGMVFQWHFSSDKLTTSPDIINSTDSACHNNLIINHFLAPDSKVASSLQGALQKSKELSTAPPCYQLASSTLIYTCATSKTDKEAPESTEDTLIGEKTLFAARYAVCELSDSADRSLVPADCSSFILAESNTKQKGWFGYGTAKGREKPFAHYPEYDQATRQNRDRCVAALQKSPVTGISYSNAKQTAHQWCSIARSDIENEKLLQNYRDFAERMVDQDDVIRAHAEAIHQQLEATEFLGKQLRTFAQNTMDTYDVLREVLTDARETVHNLVQDMGIQLQAELERFRAAHGAHDAEIRANVDKIVSEILNVTAQHSTDLSLARRNDAEEFSGRMFYVLDMVEQHMNQLFSDADNTSREVAIRGSDTLDLLQLFKYELFGINEMAHRNFEIVSNVTGQLEQLHDRQDNLYAKLENSEKVAATLESKLLSMSDIASLFTGSLYLIVTGIFFFVLRLSSWPFLALVTAIIFKFLRIALNKLRKLAQIALHAAGNSLISITSAAQQCVGRKGAVLLFFSVAGILYHSVAVETPTAYWQRLKNGELSLFEPAHCFVLGPISIWFLCAISRYANAVRESGLLQFGEYETYDDKKSAV